MFDISILVGIEKKSAADILKPVKDMVTETLGHEPERFSIELNIAEGTMRIASENRYEEFRNKAMIMIAMKAVKSKIKRKDGGKNDFDCVMGSIYWEKGKVSMAVKTSKGEILTTEFV